MDPNNSFYHVILISHDPNRGHQILTKPIKLFYLFSIIFSLLNCIEIGPNHDCYHSILIAATP